MCEIILGRGSAVLEKIRGKGVRGTREVKRGGGSSCEFYKSRSSTDVCIMLRSELFLTVSIFVQVSFILILFIFKKSICRLPLTDTERVSARDLLCSL
jgi:hypothetical protein